ncbi:TetR/AcrR family transcriptional regulator [Corynebacterium lizhenjunii]|uniref:TetR/AcrR family transcriptional regulator n=1 Tax=Corynebacterium lizhenjunii TaxID=2709394 RepID=UPI00197D99F4|nr:TetR/AcrR family transcriptional regulator [Corynebacterium lizhenjunii]
MERSKGRPTKALVTREKISSAALKIVGVQGYEKLTMARVAREIGVGPSALYNHVHGKDDLLALVQDAVMAQVDTAALRAALAGDLSPGAALRTWARSYRDVFALHAPLVEVIATTPISGAPATQEMYELVARVLVAAGEPQARIIPRIIALESFIYGSSYDAHAPANIFDLPDIARVTAHSFAAAHAAFVADSAVSADAPSIDAALAPVSADAPASLASAGSGPVSGPDGGGNPFADTPFRLGLEALLADID